MGEESGIVENISKAYQELANTFKQFFGRIKIYNHTLELISETSEIELIRSGQIHYFPMDKDIPLIKHLDESEILKKEAINIHFSKLRFQIFSLPMFFSKNVKLLNWGEIRTKINLTDLLKNNLLVRSLIIYNNLTTKARKLDIESLETNICDGIEIWEKIPFKARKKSLKEFSSKQIIQFWQLLLSNAKIPRENLELVGIFEPVPLHKIKTIKFNPLDGSLTLFLDTQKRYLQQEPVRLVVGRDKEEGKVFTIASNL